MSPITHYCKYFLRQTGAMEMAQLPQHVRRNQPTVTPGNAGRKYVKPRDHRCIIHQAGSHYKPTCQDNYY